MGDALGSFSTAIGARFTEGVETEAELQHLLRQGVAYGQGQLVGRAGLLAGLD